MSPETPIAAPPDREILECIARAEEKAGGDDAAFIRYLNECYAAKGSVKRGARLRMRGGHEDRTPRARQLLSDPRYLQNARELARRTQGGTRVVGGRPVPAKAFLDCVAVGNDRKWGCTGTLVAPDVVVTAGHCTSFATRVFFGSNVDKKGKIVRVRESILHPQYRQNSQQHDLMVLILESRVENIPSRAIAPTAVIDNATDGRVVGFGNTDPFGSAGYGIKRFVDVPIASPSCQGTLDGVADSAAYGCDSGLEFVAGKPLLAKDSCTGDSGGPFYLEDEATGWVVAGATSRATNAAANDCGDGGIYVRLDRYRDWIASLPGVMLR